MDGLTPEFLKSLGLSPEQIDAIMAREGGAAPDAAGGNPPPGATDGAPPGDMPPPMPPADKKEDMAAPVSAAMPGPAATPVPDKANMTQDDQTMMSASAFSDMQKRLGALEKKYSDATKEADMKCAAAFSDRCELVLKENAKRVAPNMKATFKQMGMDALTKKNFADATGDQEKAFAAWKAFIESLPEHVGFSEEVNDGKPVEKPARQLTAFQRAILNSRATRQNAPQMREKVLAAASVQPSAN